MVYCTVWGDIMQKKKLDKIIAQIAKAHHTTPEEVRKEMCAAMEAGQASEDPEVQKVWNSISRNGEVLTLEEFMDYMIKRAMQ